MSEVKTFFRHCPGCGRRFEIRLVSRELKDTREETYVKKTAIPYAFTYNSSRYGGFFSPLAVQEEVPTTVDVAEFNYTYRCKHCGHIWSEVHVEEEGAQEGRNRVPDAPSAMRDETDGRTP
ncbi:MAG TPA: hypothetical protein VMS77_09815 [Conexivisphaerales archaeon]|nr:hypothetical protein [Conexivisphaerales archaeon]